MIHANNVINLKKGIISMWDKYRHETKQTICIIGVLTLAVKLCKADGHFTEREEHDILNIIPHESQQKNALKRIIAEANEDVNPIEHDARNLKSLLKNEHPEFLEFIIAVLYKLAHSDNIYSQSEDDDIREVAKIFGVTKSFSEKLLEFLSKIISKIRNLMKKKEKINA